ncbi:DUF805 domain-containing protein [Bordetella petrii]|nr:DUF805 domain-containing protein [Bordetella petrii]
MQILIALICFFVLLATFFLFFRYKPPAGPNRFGAAASPVSFAVASIRFFSNYFDFRGRASRSEFWYAMLFYVAACFVIGVINPPDILSSIWLLATLVPFLSVSARRLHDTNRSGWLQLVSWIAPVGTIIGIRWFSEPPND